MEQIFNQLLKMNFEYIICDSPAGIEYGAVMALTFADEALLLSLIQKFHQYEIQIVYLVFIQAKSRRALNCSEPVKEHLLITRYSPRRVQAGEMLSYHDVQEILCIPLIGIIPESGLILHASNQGNPVIYLKNTDVSEAYQSLVSRFLGENLPFSFIKYKKPNLLQRIFRGK